METQIISSSRTDPFFTLSPDMLCVVGADGYFQRLNPRWEEQLGLSEEELLARPLLDFVHPDDRAATVLTLPQFEIRFACKDGSYRWLSWKTSTARIGDHDSDVAFYCVVHDATARKTAERRLRARSSVTRALGSAGTIAEAAQQVLQIIGESEAWQVGVFWRLDEATRTLRCEDLWHDPAKRAVEFEGITRRTTFPAGEGLPGRALAKREAIWVPDVSRDERFPRAFWAVKDGLRAACAFPIMADGEVIAVIELLGERGREPEPLLREMMGSVGAEVGQFIKRKEAEEALAACERRLSSVVSHAPVVLLAVDGKGRFLRNEGRGLAALGREPGQVVGRPFSEVYLDVPVLHEHLRRALKGEAFIDRLELPAHKACYEVSYTPVLGATGEVVEVIGVAVDVTDRRSAGAAAPTNGAATGAHGATSSPRSRRRILVIDDEPVLASALGRTLEPEFEVTVLSDGRDALRRLLADPSFDVILCDLVMPGLTGMDLYEELKRRAPGLAERMIFMTGGTFTSRARDFLATVPNPALDKPFDLSTLHALLKSRALST